MANENYCSKKCKKLVIDVTKEYKSYWGTFGKHLKDWVFSATEKIESDATKRIPEWIDEDKQYQ
jgi:hypothetical protein